MGKKYLPRLFADAGGGRFRTTSMHNFELRQAWIRITEGVVQWTLLSPAPPLGFEFVRFRGTAQ